MRTLYESIMQSRFTRLKIDESIIDSADTVTNRIHGNVIINKLMDMDGFYFAYGDYTKEENLKDGNVASFNNGVLSFYNKELGVASAVKIDFKHIDDLSVFKNIKCIETPEIMLCNPPEDLSFLGKLRTNHLMLVGCESVIKNLDQEQAPYFSGIIYILPNTDIYVDFITRVENSGALKHNCMVRAHDKITFKNCHLDFEEMGAHTEGLMFKDGSIDVKNIWIYNPSLFDYHVKDDLFDIFDKDYSFACFKDKEQQTRKTTNLRKILAYFNNKKYNRPDRYPFKLVGKLSDVVGDINNKHDKTMCVRFQDNSTAVFFSKDLTYIQRVLQTDRKHYTTDDFRLLPADSTRTKDGFYCAITGF